MRTFDEIEKQIIKKIVHGSGYSRNLINIFDSRQNLQCTRISINEKTREASYLFQIQNEEPTDCQIQWGIEKRKSLTELIITHINLLRYLEKEELATFFELSVDDKQIIEFGMGAVNMHSFSMDINDPKVIDLLIKYAHKEIIPSPTLRQLEKNNFMTDDEIKFKKQYRATWAAIVVSILLGLYGITINYQNSKNQEEQFKTQLEENRKIAESVLDKLKEVEESTIDYRPAIEKISEVTERVDIALKKKKTIN